MVVTDPLLSPAQRLAQRAWRLLHVDAPHAQQLLQRAAGQAAAIGDAPGAAWADLVRGFHELYFAAPTQAEDTLQRARTQFGYLGDRAGEILATTGQARALWRQGRVQPALALLLPLRDEGLRLLRNEKRGVLLNAIAGCYSAQGDSQTAFAYMQQALRDTGPRRGHGYDAALHCNLSHELIELGDHDEALRQVEVGLQRMVGLTNGRLLTVLRVNRAICLTELGRAAEALDDVRAVAEAVPDPSGRGLVPMHFEALAITCLRAARVDEAEALLQRCAPTLSDDRVEHALARSLFALHRGGDALTPLHEVAPLLAAEGDQRPSLRMRCLHAAALAEAHEAHGDAAAALQALRQWQQLSAERAQRASNARYQAATLQTELLRVQQRLEDQEARREAAERLSQELAEANAQLSRRMAEVEALQARLREQATQDALTGLANRRHLNETLPSVLALALREAAPLAVVLIDLDHFKQINDTHGHPVGDQVLAAFGGLLREHLRRSDLAFRYGGEEFCLLLPRTSAGDAQHKVETLLAAWRERELALDGEACLRGLSFSAGATDSRTSTPSAGALLNAADQLLLLAKRGGRARVVAPGG